MKGPSHWILPSDVEYFNCTDIYNKIPSSLQLIHHTRGTIWGVINCLFGKISYTVFKAENLGIQNDEIYILETGDKAIVYPQSYHKLKALTDDIQFKIEFYKHPQYK